LEDTDLIIIPGSKNVREDLEYLKQQGWDKQIKKHLRYGGKLLAICGGYQMLGQYIHDHEGIESKAGSTRGLDLLEFQTSLDSNKQLKQIRGTISLGNKPVSVTGYEIHCGYSYGKALDKHFANVTDQDDHTYVDGVISEDRQIIGTYLHGLFETKESMELILNWISDDTHQVEDWTQVREKELDRLADIFEQHLDLEMILQVIKNK